MKYFLPLLIWMGMTWADAASGQVKMPLHTRETLEKIAKSTHPKMSSWPATLSTEKPYFLEIDGSFYLALVAKKSANYNADELEAIGIRIASEVGNILSLQVPFSAISKLAHLSSLAYIELPIIFEPHINALVRDTRADSVHNGTNLPMPYNGKDVIVGVMDWGFDFTHPMFYDTSLTRNRILACWDMWKDVGNKPVYGYGAVYSGQAELQAAKSDTAYDRGWATHGSHVAGIAGGAGGGVGLRGMAYDCDFLFIQNRWLSTAFLDGLDWLKKEADKQGKRLVVNMSFGNYHRSTLDTFSIYHEAIKEYTRRGVVIVTSAGNNGGSSMHIRHRFAGDTIRSHMTMLPANTTFERYAGHSLIMWGERNQSFQAGFQIYNSANQPISAPLMFDTKNWKSNLFGFVYIGNDSLVWEVDAEELHPLNDKPTMRFKFWKSNSAWKMGIISTAESGEVHYYNCIERNIGTSNTGQPMLAMLPGWTSGNDSFTLSDPGVSPDVITIGAHRSSTFNQTTNTESPGIIANFSSRGPTIEGFLKPDLSAPGVNVTSAISSFTTDDYEPMLPFEFNGKTFHYSQFSGTSMSGPAVAGLCALILQANPGLSHYQIKEILRKTARRDVRMPNMPAEGNNIWGQGKATATAAIQLALNTVSITEIKVGAVRLYPNPAKDYLIFESNAERSETAFSIYDLTGKNLISGMLKNGEPLDVSGLKSGLYLLYLGAENSTVLKFVKMD